MQKNSRYPVVITFRKLVLAFMAVSALAACNDADDAGQVGSVEGFLVSSSDYQEKGQYQAAIIEARNAMQSAPEDERGVIALARILTEIGQPKEAYKALEEFAGKSGDYALALSDAYLKAGKARSAALVLEQYTAVLLDKESERDVMAGKIALARGEIDEAGSAFEKVLSGSPDNMEALLGLASVELSRGNPETAAGLVSRALAVDPENPQALLFSGSLKAREGKLDESEESLMAAVTALPSSDIITPLRYSILVALRDVLIKQGKTSEALIYSGLLSESLPGVEEINQKFSEAMQALENSDIEGARRLLDEVREKAPGSERAGTMLGVLDYLEGDNDSAVRQFEQFIDPETATPTALQIFAMAELKLNQPRKVLERLAAEVDDSQDGKLVALYGIAAVSAGEKEKGEKYLLRAVALEPENGRLRFPLVQLYNRENQREKALEQVRAAFRAQPDDPVVQSGLTQQLMVMGKVDQARDFIKGLRTSYPNSRETQLLVASFLMTQRELDEALEVLQDVLQKGDLPRARELMAGIYLSRKDYDRAEKEYRKIIALQPEGTEAYKGLITVYELQNRVEEGLQEVRKLATTVDSRTPLLVLAEYYGRNGNYDEAFRIVESLNDTDSQRVTQMKQTLYVARADRLFREGDLDQSRKILLEGLSYSPENPRLLAQLITVELAADRLEEAMKVHYRLKDVLPDAPVTAILAGDIARAGNDTDKAIKQYKLAWEKTPTDQVAAKIYSSINNNTDRDGSLRLAFLDEWQNRLPGSQVARLTRAGFYLESGDNEKALKGYEEILSGNSENAVAHNNLAWIYGEKDLDKAVAAAKKAYELAPNSPEIMDTYGWFSYKNGNLALARDLLGKAVELAPDNQEIRAHLDEVSGR